MQGARTTSALGPGSDGDNHLTGRRDYPRDILCDELQTTNSRQGLRCGRRFTRLHNRGPCAYPARQGEGAREDQDAHRLIRRRRRNQGGHWRHHFDRDPDARTRRAHQDQAAKSIGQAGHQAFAISVQLSDILPDGQTCIFYPPGHHGALVGLRAWNPCRV